MSYTSDSLEKMNAKAHSGYKSTKIILTNLGKIKAHKLDDIMQSLHEKEFQKIDCLECANCCKTISPAMGDSDVRRMAANRRMKVADFIDTFLWLDSDRDFVFKSTPCPFLLEDNKCEIYPSRPKACREYPHTDRKRFYQILDLTAKNSKVCPAVFNIIEHIRKTPLEK